MAKTLTTALKNQLATSDIRPVHLITIGFSTPVNITDCSFSLTSSVSGSSVTYNASDFIIGVSEFSEQTDITKASFKFTLSGADLTFISTVLNENVTNDEFTVYRGLLDSSNALVADPFLLYKGNIESYIIQEGDTTSSLELSIVSHWADFEKKNGRKTNNTSQQRFFSTDVGMDFSSEIVTNIRWGKV